MTSDWQLNLGDEEDVLVEIAGEVDRADGGIVHTVTRSDTGADVAELLTDAQREECEGVLEGDWAQRYAP